MQGTLILTANGLRPIETLRRGDLVATLLPRGPFLVPVAWIGYRRAAPGAATDQSSWPVLIRRDAIGDGSPASDLLLAPEHAVYLGSSLFLPRMLVNGHSIRFRRPVEPAPLYWGLRLEIPNLVVAQNLPVETLLPAATGGFITAAEPSVTPQVHRPGRPRLRLVKG